MSEGDGARLRIGAGSLNFYAARPFSKGGCRPSIFHMKCRTIFRLALAPVVEAGSGDVGMAQPFLDFGDVRLV